MSSLSSAEIQRVSSNYAIDPIGPVGVNQQGITNETIELGNEHFLTIFKWRDTTELEAIAYAANSLSPDVPLVRPIMGENGYVFETDGGPALLTPRIAGKHYVGINQLDKKPIPSEIHPSLARSFWALQLGLSDVPENVKRVLLPAREIPDQHSRTDLPDYVQPLLRLKPSDLSRYHMPVYGDLVHDDMERQNVLSVGSEVTGIVDLDSLMVGDVLYQFGHFVFNFAFCDPNADLETADPYLEELEKAEVILPKDVPAIYPHIYDFVLNDLAEIEILKAHSGLDDERAIDLEALCLQYQDALNLARRFFNHHYKAV
ncbi:MAG: phosphotransferase [Candidatus Saccharimonadales bacterium]